MMFDSKTSSKRWNATYLDYSSHVAPDIQDYGKNFLRQYLIKNSLKFKLRKRGSAYTLIECSNQSPKHSEFLTYTKTLAVAEQ